jgi:transposase
MITHQPYPSDVSDAEWEFVLPYLCLLPEDSGQRVHNLRDVLDALRWLVRAGSPWRYLPKDFPPWHPPLHPRTGKGDAASVRREKVLVFSGCNSHPATGSLQPVAIGAAVEPFVAPSAAPSRPVNSGLGDLVLIATCLYYAIW